MANFFSQLNTKHLEFIQHQKMFFVATAPSSGRINLSPKGMDTFRIIDAKHVAYLDLTGAGNETAAHIKDNGRMTVMFCSFDTEPLILRLYGRGTVITPNHAQWRDYLQSFQPIAGMRQIILLSIDSLQTSCGFAVPLYHFEGERDTLLRWAEKKGDKGIHQYWLDRNQTSIDELPTGLLTDD